MRNNSLCPTSRIWIVPTSPTTFSLEEKVSRSPGRKCLLFHLQRACSEAAGLMLLLHMCKDMGCRCILARAQGSAKQLEAASASSSTPKGDGLKTGTQPLLLMGMHQLGRIAQPQGQHTAYSCKLPCTMVCTKVVLLLLKTKRNQNKNVCESAWELNYISPGVGCSSEEQNNLRRQLHNGIGFSIRSELLQISPIHEAESDLPL